MSRFALRMAGITGLLMTWQLISWMQVWPPYLFPSPADVAATIARLAVSGYLSVAILTTLRRIAIGFGGAAVVGVLVGLALARCRWFSEAFGPVVQGLQSLPSICWFPLAILWLGLGEGAIWFVTTVGTLFAIAVGTEAAIRNLPPTYLRAAATMGARGWRLYSRVVLPASMPNLVTSLRVGWSFAWRSLMAAELLVMNLGMGHLLNMGRELADAAQVVSVILMILIIGLAVDRLLFARWERSIRRRWGFEIVT